MTKLTSCQFLLIFLLSSFITLSGQQTISGKLIDAQTSEPLIGASIIVPGTDIGTITDFDGNYTLEIPDGINEVEISYTGYQAQLLNTAGLNNLEIALAPGELIEEVVWSIHHYLW